MGIKKEKTVFKIIAICFIVVSIGIGVFLILRGSESHISSTGPEDSIGALICKSQSQVSEIISIKNSISSEHEIKITYRGESLGRISYSYRGVFENSDQAEKASSGAHADYNIYMGKYGLDPEILSPAFIASDEVLRIDLYTSVDKLSNVVAPLFFLSNAEIYDLQNTSIDKIQTFYENEGFTCITNNNQ